MPAHKIFKSVDEFYKNHGSDKFRFPSRGTYNYWEWGDQLKEFFKYKITITKKTPKYLYFYDEQSKQEFRHYISKDMNIETVEGWKHLKANQLWEEDQTWTITDDNYTIYYNTGKKIKDMPVAGEMDEATKKQCIEYLEKPLRILTEDDPIKSHIINLAKQHYIELQELKRKYAFLKESIGNVLKYH